MTAITAFAALVFLTAALPAPTPAIAAQPAAAPSPTTTPSQAGAAPPAAGPTSAGALRYGAQPPPSLRQLVPTLLAKYHVPGLALTVVQHRAVGWTACFGVKRAGEPAPVTEQTIFEAASLSKPVVAYAAMREVARGALALDKPLASYLAHPYLTADPAGGGAGITARQVLSHTSGLPNWARGKPLATIFPPGTRFGYSGEGYVYLGHVLERIAGGVPLAELLRQRVLAPLGMSASSFVWRPDYEAAAAAPHDRDGKAYSKEKPAAANAAASLHTTAPDYARFLAAMLDPVVHRDLLAPPALGQMLVPQVLVDAHLRLSWGLGWGLEQWQGQTTFFHWGSNDGFRAFVLGDAATGDGLVVFTNGAAGLDLIAEMVAAVEGREHPLFRFPMLHPND